MRIVKQIKHFNYKYIANMLGQNNINNINDWLACQLPNKVSDIQIIYADEQYHVFVITEEAR